MSANRTRPRPPGDDALTVGVQRDDIRGVQNLHRQSLLRSLVVALQTDPAVASVFQGFLKQSRRIVNHSMVL